MRRKILATSRRLALPRLLLILVLAALTAGCSGACSTAGRTKETQHPITAAGISFSAQTLPPIFQLVVGGKSCADYKHLITTTGAEKSFNSICNLPLGAIIGEDAFLPDSFWLVSPFYEPREFFFEDFDLTEPIELGSLSSAIPMRNIEMKQLSEAVLEAGPTIWARNDENDGSKLYDWASLNTLLFYSPPQGAGLIKIGDLANTVPFILEVYNPDCLAISPDARKAAYIDKGYLIVEDLVSSEKKKWALTKNPEDQSFSSFSTELLSWSPNGRFILGSNYAYYEHYLNKLWVLDLETGKVTAFNALCTHSFCRPLWSPDGNQAVVTELYKPYTADFQGQWDLLDLRGPKIIAAARKEKAGTAYDFSWDKTGKLRIEDCLSNLIEFCDPVLNLEQQEFQASRPGSLSTFQATSLHFLPAGDREEFSLDLKPALKECGLELEDIETLLFDPLRTPDGNYLVLQGRAATLNAVRTYAIYGRVDLTTEKISFLEPVWIRPEDRAFILCEQFPASENKVLLLPEEKTLRILDVNTMTSTKLPIQEHVFAAGWVGDKILYITRSGIFLTDSKNTQTIQETNSNEIFLPGIKLSSDKRFAVIPRKKPYTGMLDEINFTIIDLAGLEEASGN